MQTTERPAALSDTQKATLADLLGSWAVIPETEGYDAAYRTTLRYTGDEPLLQGAEVSLNGSSYGHAGMLHCSGRGQSWDGAEHHYLGNFLSRGDRDKLGTSINISASKTVEQIAKDMQRRLLPLYLGAYALGMAQLANAKTRQARQRELAAEIAAMLPEGRVKGGDRLSEESRIWWSGPSWTISHYSIHLEGVSMRPAQARLMAALLTSAAWTDAPKGDTHAA